MILYFNQSSNYLICNFRSKILKLHFFYLGKLLLTAFLDENVEELLILLTLYNYLVISAWRK